MSQQQQKEPGRNLPARIKMAIAAREVGPRSELMLATGQKAQIAMRQVEIDPVLTYKLDKSGGKNGEPASVGIVSSGWDFIARLIGIQWGELETLESTPDLIRMRLSCKYYATNGELMPDVEEYEVNARRAYAEKRASWPGGKSDWHREREAKARAAGFLEDQPVWGDDPSTPIGFRRTLPPEGERECWLFFLQAQANMRQKTITSLHRRLVQRAAAAKGLKPNADGKVVLHVPQIRAVFEFDAKAADEAGKAAADVAFGPADPDLAGEEITDAEFLVHNDPAPAPGPAECGPAAAAPEEGAGTTPPITLSDDELARLDADDGEPLPPTKDAITAEIVRLAADLGLPEQGLRAELFRFRLPDGRPVLAENGRSPGEATFSGSTKQALTRMLRLLRVEIRRAL